MFLGTREASILTNKSSWPGQAANLYFTRERHAGRYLDSRLITCHRPTQNVDSLAGVPMPDNTNSGSGHARPQLPKYDRWTGERQVEVEIDGQLYILRVGDPDGDRTRPGT